VLFFRYMEKYGVAGQTTDAICHLSFSCWTLKSTNTHSECFIKYLPLFYYRLLIGSYPDQEGNKLGNMSETLAISTTSRRELISSFFSCKATRRMKFPPFSQKRWLVSFPVGLRIYQHPCTTMVTRTRLKRTLYLQCLYFYIYIHIIFSIYFCFRFLMVAFSDQTVLYFCCD